MSCTVNPRTAINLNAPLVRVRDDAVTAFNSAADVVDFLDVLGMALSSHDDAVEPFLQLTTVLNQARKIAIDGREAASRASQALSKEVGL